MRQTVPQPEFKMYKIIGADGKEYGPVSVEQLRQWLTEGRVNKQTRVLAEGRTDWRTLGELPELAAVLPAAAAAMPPALPMASDQSTARQLIRGPAIFILVLAILNLLWVPLSFALSSLVDQMVQSLGAASTPDETMEQFRKTVLYFSLPLKILGATLALITLVGSIQMLKLRSYGLAMATAIVMLIPCGSCCCFLNIGAGIWALVVLSKPEVKAAFE